MGWWLKYISIPHWFYSNAFYVVRCHVDCEISIPHWFYSNSIVLGTQSRAITISIPHWFYSNVRYNWRNYIFAVFQYHTGSIQTDEVIEKIMTDIIFQYHTGSIQTRLYGIDSPETSQFQYHTGSIQTVKSEVVANVVANFNTTLVLFKHSIKT